MGVLDSLRRYWQQFVASGTDEGPVTQEDSGRSSGADGRREQGSADDAAEGYRGPAHYDFDPDAIQSRADIVEVTGYTPREFVTRLLEAEGGRLPQQALVEYTDLSAASISRYLQDLENEDVVVRLEIGREKVVFLPETAPSARHADDSRTQQRSPS